MDTLHWNRMTSLLLSFFNKLFNAEVECQRFFLKVVLEASLSTKRPKHFLRLLHNLSCPNRLELKCGFWGEWGNIPSTFIAKKSFKHLAFGHKKKGQKGVIYVKRLAFGHVPLLHLIGLASTTGTLYSSLWDPRDIYHRNAVPLHLRWSHLNGYKTPKGNGNSHSIVSWLGPATKIPWKKNMCLMKTVCFLFRMEPFVFLLVHSQTSNDFFFGSTSMRSFTTLRQISGSFVFGSPFFCLGGVGGVEKCLETFNPSEQYWSTGILYILPK